MKRSIKLITYIFVGCLFAYMSASAQVQGTSALLIGKLTDKSGQSLGGVRFSLNNESRKIRGKTDSEGTFQQVVKPGATYIIEWQHPSIVLRRDTVNIPNTGKYVEHNAVFTPQSIAVGDMLVSGNIFTRGAANFTSENELQMLALSLKEYGRLSATITICDDAPEAKAKKTKAKPAKKSKKGKVEPAKTLTQSLVSLREEAVSAYFSKNYPQLIKRIQITASAIPGTNSFSAKVTAVQAAIQSDL